MPTSPRPWRSAALFGLMGPFAAAFMNRFGIRKVSAAALLLIPPACSASLAMRQAWQLLLLWGHGRAWHRDDCAGPRCDGRDPLVLRRRGLVVGMLTASNATGQLIFLPMLAQPHRALWLACRDHLRRGRAAAGAACWSLLLMRDRPCESVCLAMANGAERRPRHSNRACWTCCGRRCWRCAMPRGPRCSGCCSPPSSSAGSAPTA